MIITNNKKLKNKLYKGVKKLYKVVSKTYGPNGSPVILKDVITKDGVTVANHVILEDPIENIGALTVRRAAIKTNQECGDGTTTTTVFCHKIFKTFKDKNYNFKDVDKILLELSKNSVKCKKEDLYNIAFTASNNDENLAKLISELIWNVGTQGTINVEQGDVTTTEIQEGYVVNCNVVRDSLIQHKNKELTNPEFLILKSPCEENENTKEFLNSNILFKKDMVIVAPKFTDSFIDLVYRNFRIKNPNICLIELSAGNFYSEAIKSIELFKNSNKVFVKKGFVLFNGKPNLKQRLEDLHKLLKLNDSELVQEEINNLLGNIGTLKLQYNNQAQYKELYDRAEDTINSCKNALKYGISNGGGRAYKEIANNFNDDIKSILETPYNIIEPKEKVIDPTYTLQQCIKNAFEATETLLSCQACIV